MFFFYFNNLRVCHSERAIWYAFSKFPWRCLTQSMEARRKNPWEIAQIKKLINLLSRKLQKTLHSARYVRIYVRRTVWSIVDASGVNALSSLSSPSSLFLSTSDKIIILSHVFRRARPTSVYTPSRFYLQSPCVCVCGRAYVYVYVWVCLCIAMRLTRCSTRLFT